MLPNLAEMSRPDCNGYRKSKKTVCSYEAVQTAVSDIRIRHEEDKKPSVTYGVNWQTQNGVSHGGNGYRRWREGLVVNRMNNHKYFFLEKEKADSLAEQITKEEQDFRK